MPQILVPADVEQAVIRELTFANYRAWTAIPTSKPQSFFRVTASGGYQRDLVSDSRIVTIEAFATKEATAERDAAHALGLLQYAQSIKGTLDGIPFYDLSVAALPQNFPLPSLPGYTRYTTTLGLVLRRSLVTV